MAGAAVGETVDAGEERSVGVWDLDLLTAIFGDDDLSVFDSDDPVDYSAIDQETSLAALFTD